MHPEHSFKLIDYVRFAQLSASQKAAARKLYQQEFSRQHELCSRLGMANTVGIMQPLVNCWFLPEGDAVCAHGFFERDPLQPAAAT